MRFGAPTRRSVMIVHPRPSRHHGIVRVNRANRDKITPHQKKNGLSGHQVPPFSSGRNLWLSFAVNG